MKKYLALTIGYKQLLIPFDATDLLSSIEKIIVCDEKGYGKDKRFEEDKDFEMSLTVVGESQVVFNGTEVFDAVSKANAHAEEVDRRYWDIKAQFHAYKKQNPPHAVPESTPTDAPTPSSEPPEEFF